MRTMGLAAMLAVVMTSAAPAQDAPKNGFDWRGEAAKWWSLYDPDSFQQYGDHLWGHDWKGRGWGDWSGGGCDWSKWDWSKWVDPGSWGGKGWGGGTGGGDWGSFFGPRSRR